MKNLVKSMAFALAMSVALPQAFAETQGVTDTEILIGSNNDLSGIFAAFGAPAIAAAKQYFDQVNAAGGVHGRQLRLIAEDHAYQMPKAMQNINKLINSDQVFVMLLSLGTPMNIASFPLLERKGIANIGPLSAARQMVEPLEPYKFAGFSSYYDQMKAGVNYLKENNDAKVVCAMYIPSDFGKEIQEGAKDAAADLGLEYKSETTHKPDEQDFVGSLTKLKDEGCDTIATALGIRQTITALATAKKIGWDDVDFIGSSAAFHTAVAKVPGGVTEGFYAAAGWPDLGTRMDDPHVKKFVEDYQAEFGEFPGTGALLGRSSAEGLVMALEAAGPDLTSESFLKAQESLDYIDPITGVRIDYGPTDHQGGDAIIISRIDGGDWKVVGEQ
ncbi:ABC transporter substrate-binding protein [Hoeflea prorocentri]|uniref:ABC transporter substrate-binding protein n=1 Tax=Hoeflea prorocentri TaxID=1922333 RepID=A0A9X3UI25_9HYPH|nr:ABC transporter substrate-binding protein [Hoeflea prorocentri]MCY6380825.1 ABC transporter substrate-binding protein [Hoeflea prorocentri]MDA5398625.1 ABC transporter substrate-binding protein [Hoeflea prorocentri]